MSQKAEGVQGFWKTIYVDSEDPEDAGYRIGLGFKMPKPVIEFNNVSSNNFEEVSEAGIIFDEEKYDNDQNGQNGPMYFPFKNIIPPNIFIGNYKERAEKDEYFNDGDLWLRVFDPMEDSVMGDQITISLKNRDIIENRSRFYLYKSYEQEQVGSATRYYPFYHLVDDNFSNITTEGLEQYSRPDEKSAFVPFEGYKNTFYNNITLYFKNDFNEADLSKNDIDLTSAVKYIDSVKNYISVSASFMTNAIIGNEHKYIFPADRAKYFTHWTAVYAPVRNDTIDYSTLLTISGKIGSIEQKKRIQFNQYSVVYCDEGSNESIDFELKNIISSEENENVTYPNDNSDIRLCALVLYDGSLTGQSDVVLQQNTFEASGNDLENLHEYLYNKENGVYTDSNSANNNRAFLKQYIINSLNITYS